MDILTKYPANRVNGRKTTVTYIRRFIVPFISYDAIYTETSREQGNDQVEGKAFTLKV